MNRFWRIAWAVAACCAAVYGQQYRAFWADAFHRGYKTPQQIEQMVEDVALAKGNAILMEVRIEGGSYYLRSLEPPVEDAEYAPGFDALQYLIEKAHARGIEVHAWFPVTKLWSRARAPLDPKHAWNLHGPHAQGDDMWMTVSSTGARSTSVDPGHPAVLQYLADMMLEPAKHYAIDGIHLDYIRYPEDANYGWNPKSVERFQRLRNRVGNPSANDAAWSEFRREQVTALVRQVYLRAMAIQPKLKISAALITWGTGPLTDTEFRGKDAYARVFQNWPAWMEEGIIDLGMPMHYFDETRFSVFLDRWLDYGKARQHRRALVPGLGVYLNTIPNSVKQTLRVLAPSQDRTPLGVIFYSYASANLLDARGQPIVPNEQFYRAIAENFGDPGRAPVLPWKEWPQSGHIYGTLAVDSGPAWLVDGAQVIVESDTGASTMRRAVTDGTGFFGLVDLPPDRYRLRIERAGEVVYRATPQDVAAGRATGFALRLPAGAFERATPRFTVDRISAAPNDLVTLNGSLPGLERGLCQALANGRAATLTPNAQVVLPNVAAESWTLMVRCAGLESASVTIAGVAAAPRITGVSALPNRYLSIYATGLGLAGGPLPFPTISAPVRVLARAGDGREFDLAPSFAAQIPMLAGAYLVNVQMPEGAEIRSVRVRSGETASAPFTLP